MDPLNTLSNFDTEMEPDGQGNYSLFPALDNIASLSGASESLETWVRQCTFHSVAVIFVIGVFSYCEFSYCEVKILRQVATENCCSAVFKIRLAS